MPLHAHIESVHFVQLPDDDPDLSWLDDSHRYDGCTPDEIAEYAAQDKERMASYGDAWVMLGIRAVARIKFATDIPGGWQYGPRVESAGIWGVESDSGQDYLDQLAHDELVDLRDQLLALGFTETDCDEAFTSAHWADQ